MKFVSEAEFLKDNQIIANQIIRRILLVLAFIAPVIAIGTYFKFFDTNYKVCLFMWLISLGAYGILCYLGRASRNYNKAKYFGLIAVEMVIACMATQKSIGVYISFGFIPIISCIYMDVKFTRVISAFSYIMMIIALYFRSFQATLYDYPSMTPREWFISQALGFTIEFIILTLALSAIVTYLREILENSYRLGKQKYYYEEADKIKKAFLANLSEELRTPLDEVEKVSQLLLEETAISNAAKEKVQHIAKKNEMLYTFLDDLEDFSKLQLDKVEIVEEKYHLTELIEGISSTIVSRIGEKNIDLNVVMNPSIPDKLYGDPLRIRQILIHLLNNTVKYIEDGFIVLRIDWKKKDETAILNIEVMDTGYGIEEETIVTLFENFCKLERNEEIAMEGVGLGLPICKKLCEMMNGKISVRSGYGLGSLFTVTIPQRIAKD